MIRLLLVFLLVDCSSGRENLKDMSAARMNTYLNAPEYEAGTPEGEWERIFYNEKLSYATRNKCSDVLSDFEAGRIRTDEALRRMRRIVKAN